jgi:hypothetical protein
MVAWSTGTARNLLDPLRPSSDTHRLGVVMGGVVHVKQSRYDVYIGRGWKSNWGNPFSHKQDTKALVQVASREEAVARYRSWLLGDTDKDLAQDQRKWILENLHTLRGKVLGCWCAPKACHGDVLHDMANPTDSSGLVGQLMQLSQLTETAPIKVACVGSRDLGEGELAFCQDVGKWLVERGFFVGSGNAEGADHNYAVGGNSVNPQRVVLYLPWMKFNVPFLDVKNHIRLPPFSKQAAYETIVREHHPYGPQLRRRPFALHTRNCAILDGAKFCVAWPSSTGGGTQFAITVARLYGVPVLNLADDDERETLLQVLDY